MATTTWPSAHRHGAGVGDVFTMTLTMGAVPPTTIVEFDEGGSSRGGRRNRYGTARSPMAWRLEPVDDLLTPGYHTYDWSRLTDETRCHARQPRPKLQRRLTGCRTRERS